MTPEEFILKSRALREKRAKEIAASVTKCITCQQPLRGAAHYRKDNTGPHCWDCSGLY